MQKRSRHARYRFCNLCATKKNTEIHLDTLYTHILYIHLIKTKNSVQTTL